jgi:hypothetical protein
MFVRGRSSYYEVPQALRGVLHMVAGLSVLVVLFLAVGCGPSGAESARAGGPGASSATLNASTAPTARTGDAPATTTPPSAPVASAPALPSGVCGPFGAKFERAGSFGRRAALWVPMRKEDLPPAVRWGACGAPDFNHVGTPPKGCAQWVPTAWFRSHPETHRAQVDHGLDGSTRLLVSALTENDRCETFAAVLPSGEVVSGEVVSAAAFVGPVMPSRSWVAGEGMVGFAFMVPVDDDMDRGLGLTGVRSSRARRPFRRSSRPRPKLRTTFHSPRSRSGHAGAPTGQRSSSRP